MLFELNNFLSQSLKGILSVDDSIGAHLCPLMAQPVLS